MRKRHPDPRAAGPAAGRDEEWSDTPPPGAELPDLTGVDLARLRELRGPALTAVLDELVRRTVEPSGTTAKFTNNM